jgi:predicted membrane channel-forming protein YqfA (hemolysin III family)
MKWLGFLLIFLSCYNFEQGEYSAKLIFMFLLGLLMVCGISLIEHLFFVEREKVREQFRRRR